MPALHRRSHLPTLSQMSRNLSRHNPLTQTRCEEKPCPARSSSPPYHEESPTERKQSDLSCRANAEIANQPISTGVSLVVSFCVGRRYLFCALKFRADERSEYVNHSEMDTFRPLLYSLESLAILQLCCFVILQFLKFLSMDPFCRCNLYKAQCHTTVPLYGLNQ